MNCNFNENYCPKGGAIYTKYASIELKDSTFNKNSANYGGALFLRTDNNYIINNIFKNNQASIKGGAIFSKMDKVSSNYCKYVNNKAPISSNVYGVFKEELYRPECIGSISEVYDAKSPYKPGGAPAQCWSVAEVSRIVKEYNK